MYKVTDTLALSMFESPRPLVSMKSPKTSGIISDLEVIRSVYETIPENEEATHVRKQLFEQFTEGAADLNLEMYETIGASHAPATVATAPAKKRLVSRMTSMVKEMSSEFSFTPSQGRILVSN